MIKISIYFDPERDFHNFLVWVFKWLFKFAKILDDRNEKKWKKKKEEYENAKLLMKEFEKWNVACGRAPNDFGEENRKLMKKYDKDKKTEKFALNFVYSFFAIFITCLFFGLYSKPTYVTLLYNSISLLVFIFVFLKNS